MKINLKPVLIAFTLLATLYILLGSLDFNQENTEIHYDKFLNELQKGNISKVQIHGDKLDGVFTNSQEFFVYFLLRKFSFRIKSEYVAIEVFILHLLTSLFLQWGLFMPPLHL